MTDTGNPIPDKQHNNDQNVEEVDSQMNLPADSQTDFPGPPFLSKKSITALGKGLRDKAVKVAMYLGVPTVTLINLQIQFIIDYKMYLDELEEAPNMISTSEISLTKTADGIKSTQSGKQSGNKSLWSTKQSETKATELGKQSKTYSKLSSNSGSAMSVKEVTPELPSFGYQADLNVAYMMEWRLQTISSPTKVTIAQLRQALEFWDLSDFLEVFDECCEDDKEMTEKMMPVPEMSEVENNEESGLGQDDGNPEQALNSGDLS